MIKNMILFEIRNIIYLIVLLVTISNVASEDFYKLLGVSQDATKSDIRRAFKKLALEKHPDKNPNDAQAHETFTKINTAYEVLKDDDLRKKYDTYGEEGLKDDHFSNKYQSWNFYNEQFGIYDDDPEIITLSKADFEQAVSGSEDVWFINFYSPHCSHCHTLAPVWRDVAKELNGVIRIGAVNCHDDWMLCNMQRITGYPSLRLYPTGEYYYGEHDKEKMVQHIMNSLDTEVLRLTRKMIKEVIPESQLPWLISFCEEDRECVTERTLFKLTAMLENLVYVARADCDKDETLCKLFGTSTALNFYPARNVKIIEGKLIRSLATMEILEEVLKSLPEPVDVNDEMFQKIRRNISEGLSSPWLFVFRDGVEETDLELRKLSGLAPTTSVGSVNCKTALSLCNRFYINKYPTVLFYKIIGYEFHHGRYNAHDIANFAKESASSNVRVLNPEDFPRILEKKENWFVDFFAPWCPPCMKLLPEWRKAGKQVGEKVAKFGTVDCTIHKTLCLQQNVRSYPTTIFYNQSEPHVYSGFHTAENVIAFAEDILKPPVVTLTPETFESLVNNKRTGETWVVDFYAPWCGPCMELAPTFRQLAKRLYGEAHLGTIDCQKYAYFCSTQSIHSYPTIRLYPFASPDATHYVRHQGWRDVESLYTWVFQHFPSVVEEIDEHRFFDEVVNSEKAWLIDFFAPWCGHCHTFAPHFSKLAKRLEGKVKTAKVDCEAEYSVCRSVGIRSYPTVILYPGVLYEGMSQAVNGVPLNSLDPGYLYETTLHVVENHKRDKEREKQQGVHQESSKENEHESPMHYQDQSDDTHASFEPHTSFEFGAKTEENDYDTHYVHDEF